MKTLKNLFLKRLLVRRESGQALVIVLAFVMLMTVMILVFFASVSTERASSKAAASGNSARQLAQSAVQLVEGTISQATVPGANTTSAWASQPGMIRTYGSGTAASSAPLAYYKLYSSSQMVINSSSTLPVSQYTVDADVASGGDLISNWDQLPALYTDLNAPAAASDGTLVFPIVDPRAQAAPVSVDGFSYSASTPPATGSITMNGVTTGGGASSLLPMPVQWIYVLRDGTLTSPTEPTMDPAPATNVANFAGSSTAPTANNPIVGRIAFWTDDECAKVNLNTASEGTFWDAPICNTGTSGDVFSYTPPSGSNQTGQTTPLGEYVLAYRQPAQHEFQRYPGHPATTCLSEVFGSAITAAATFPAGFSSLPFRAGVVGTFTTAAPRINDLDAPDATPTVAPVDSSLGGTQIPSSASLTGVPLKIDRLYTTVDEYNFSAASTTPRTQQTLGGASPQQIVEECRFFLTTSSKAPELNPFGLPRIAIWPVWDSTVTNYAQKISLYDKAILHCATVANGAAVGSQHQMIFTRLDCTSPTTDLALPRNTALISYLHNLAATPIPGFGGNFTTKYGATDVNQIIAEIFDYIRCTNLADQTAPTSAGPPVTGVPTGSNICTSSYTPSLAPGAVANNVAVGQVVPASPSSTSSIYPAQGFGRIPTIRELAIGLIKIDDRSSQTLVEGSSNQITTLNIVNGPVSSITPASQTLVEWSIIPNFYSAMAGYVALGGDIRFHIVVDPTNPLTIGGTQITQTGNAPPGSTGPFTDLFTTPLISAGARAGIIGGNMGPDDYVSESGGQGNSMFPTGLVVINNSNLPVGAHTTTISGGLIVTVFSPNTAAQPIQTLHFSFPPTTIPIPSLNTPTAGAYPNTWLGTVRNYSFSPGNFTYNSDPTKKGTPSGPYNSFFQSGTMGTSPHGLPNSDVIRSLTPADTPPGTSTSQATLTPSGPSINGDMRMIALSQIVPASAFQLTPKRVANVPTAPTGTDYEVNSVLFGAEWTLAGAQGGGLSPLVPASSYRYINCVPPGVVSAHMTNLADGTTNPVTTPGDWDNGPGTMVDGPYANKPDEGQIGTTGSSTAYIGSSQQFTSQTQIGTTYFSPNRQVSSPVMFGSLPVGLDHPWRTLLFRPASLPGYQVATGSYTHPGGLDPTIPDHLLLDFFRMPIVEPYCISEPLASGGKINLNAQIAPFTYITRTTGLRAVLKSVMVSAIPNNQANQYKNPVQNSTNTFPTRYPIDLTLTLQQLMLKTGDINVSGVTTFPQFSRSSHSAAAPNFFVSPSQVCDLPLIPLVPNPNTITTAALLTTFWNTHSLTGDNSLEKPYSLIYPRVTTQSNTFTVHVRAQSLQKIRNSLQTTWTEGTDQVTGEYRGSFTVEKYFDPTTATITTSDGTVQTDANDAAPAVDAAVRSALWRLIYDKRFGQ